MWRPSSSSRPKRCGRTSDGDGEPKPSGWDIRDWIEADGDVGKLIDICKQVPAETIEPVDLWAQSDPPPLPRGLLPDVVEQFAFAEAELMGADPAGLAMSGLTACAAALPDFVQIQPKRHYPRWRESARLWVGMIG